jgi:hypothetical protein
MIKLPKGLLKWVVLLLLSCVWLITCLVLTDSPSVSLGLALYPLWLKVIAVSFFISAVAGLVSIVVIGVYLAKSIRLR